MRRHRIGAGAIHVAPTVVWRPYQKSWSRHGVSCIETTTLSLDIRFDEPLKIYRYRLPALIWCRMQSYMIKPEMN